MLLSRLQTLAAEQAQQPALQNKLGTVSYGELYTAVKAVSGALDKLEISNLGLLMDNGPAWVIMDLAALDAGITVVPLPTFFSDAQIGHVIQQAGIDALCTDIFLANEWSGFVKTDAPLPRTRLYLSTSPDSVQKHPAGTAKITFTSGTTGQPKGVCLSAESMFAVADSIVQLTADFNIKQHTCLLPLSLLLENIAGVYAPLLAGATISLPDSEERGLHGSQQLDIIKLFQCLHRYRPDSLVLVPQMLKALTMACEQGLQIHNKLSYVAVGGARVSSGLLNAARQAGLPAYEGYGLSEAASVVSLNMPGNERAGSAGRPLPHVQLKISDDDEILVSGANLLGYTGQAAQKEKWYATGDLGYIDDDGFLHLTGRRKNMFVTAYGRNVNPEWPESELIRFPEIAQAVVFGEAREHNVAVIQPANEQLPDTIMEKCIATANAELPDYARVHDWVRARQTFSPENGLLTASGKPQRDAVWNSYQTSIESLDSTDTRKVC
jgi:long-chain acyl-CoA synthetase